MRRACAVHHLTVRTRGDRGSSETVVTHWLVYTSRVASNRKPLRRLVIGSASYLWKVEHRHNVLDAPPAGAPRGGRCREVFTAFVEGHKRAPLRVWFTDGEGENAGYPEAGVVWTARQSVNLNEPRVARRVIEHALDAGWAPTVRAKPFVIENGFALLEQLAD